MLGTIVSPNKILLIWVRTNYVQEETNGGSLYKGYIGAMGRDIRGI